MTSTIVVNASVIIKWIFPQRDDEEGVTQALNILTAIKHGKIKILQPPHWLAEVAAVVVRLEPRIAEQSIELLNAMEFPSTNTPEIYNIACQLSTELNHHLFDTLYHAVALYNDKVNLVTANEKYFRKAHNEGGIMRLVDF